MMSATEFNIQRALHEMETRIREDIRSVGAECARAQMSADEARLMATVNGGRLASLEEKARWVGAGFGTVFVALFGFFWHVIKASWRPGP
jgi:hypothetical protein